MLPPGVELSLYRVVQEALTNARKHAAGAPAVVVVRYRPGAVEAEIIDDGTGSAKGYGGGHGLIGMRERVAVYGGTLHAGPAPGGGYGVQAHFPVQEAQ